MRVQACSKLSKCEQAGPLTCSTCSRLICVMRQKVTLPASVIGLTPLELARKISMADAAAHNSVHVDTFKRNYPHLLRRIGKRRIGVTVHDAIVLPPPPDGSR